MRSKPQLVVSAPHYDFFEVMYYLKDKYNVKHHVGLRSFWHWVVNDSMYEIYNGCFITICINPNHIEDYYGIEDIEEFKDEQDHAWKFLNLLYDEFKEDEMRFWVEW